MKIAVFSDIHGNLRALNTVLERINEKKPDLTVFLGDIFQRGNEEAECLEVLRKSGIVCIKGNCELYLANGVDIDPDVEYLRVYYDSARSKLSDEQMRFVRQMPLSYEIECCGHRLFFSHFLFSDINASYPFHQLSSLKNGIFDKACESEDVRKYDLVAIGHSHQSFVKGNVVSVSASGLENPSFLLIDADDDLNYEVISVDDREKKIPGEEIIETDRLLMRRLRPDDYLAMAAWDMDERVYKYLMSSVCKTPEEPLVWLPKKDPTSKINILMLVIDKEDGHAVGTYALNHVVERDVWTLSYVNRFDDWGKGYATEGMKAFMDHAVKVYGARSFEGECAKENVGSAMVMKKLGMVYDHSSSYSKNDGSATFESDVYVLKIDNGNE